jgi:hypothetical protein
VTAVEFPNRAVALAAELAVLRALEAAGKRARLPRSIMGQINGTPTHLVHTVVPLATTEEGCDRLLAGVWLHLELVVGDARLVEILDSHTRALILARVPLDREALLANLEAAYA